MTNKAKALPAREEFEFLFSICTLATDMSEYNEMIASFDAAGFSRDFCEYLYIDNNKSNTLDAYRGINRFLRNTSGKYIIICHQDILLCYDNVDDLIKRIDEIEEADPDWAVLGNAGGVNLKHLSLYIDQPGAPMLFETTFPLRTMTLDENFLVVKNSANLSLSNKLSGFHLYGTDICLVADILGYRSYVIEFKLLHKSMGNADRSYNEIRSHFIKNYTRALRPRFFRTPFARFYVSGSRLKTFINNTGLAMFLARKYYQVFRKPEDYQLKVRKR